MHHHPPCRRCDADFCQPEPRERHDRNDSSLFGRMSAGWRYLLQVLLLWIVLMLLSAQLALALAAPVTARATTQDAVPIGADTRALANKHSESLVFMCPGDTP